MNWTRRNGHASPWHEKMIAYHEVGHPFAESALGLRTGETSIVPKGTNSKWVFGYCVSMPSLRWVSPTVHQQVYETEMIVTLAGPEAGKYWSSQCSSIGDYSDLKTLRVNDASGAAAGST